MQSPLSDLGTQQILEEESGAEKESQSVYTDSEVDLDLEEMRFAYENRYPGPFVNPWCVFLLSFLGVLMIVPMIWGYITATNNGMNVAQTVLSALTTWLFLPPAILVLFVVFFRHRHRADYRGVSKFMCCGMASIVPVMIVELILIVLMGFILGSFMNRQRMMEHLESLQRGEEIKLSGTGDYVSAIFSVFYISFVVAAFVEETAKFFLAFLIRSHSPIVQTPMTVVILVTIGALGFGTLENFGYVFAEAMKGNPVDTIISALERAILSVPLHATTGMLIGVSVAQLPTTPTAHPSFREYLKLIWLPILVHGLFDVFALIGGGLGGYFRIVYIVNCCILIGAVVKAYGALNETLKRPPYNTEATFDNSLGV